MKPIEYLIRTFCPPICVSCDEATGFYSTLPYCEECLKEIEDNRLFSTAEAVIPYVDCVYTMYDYNSEAVKNSVFHIKKLFSPLFAAFYTERVQEIFALYGIQDKVDIVTYATRRKAEYYRVGIDQAEEMSLAISKATGLPHMCTLERTRDSKKQRALTPTERFKNVENLFKATVNLTNKRVLLVDDVMTTGSTLSDCARALREAGAVSVFVLVFAT
ncbi:MAG: ComF family protein [Clostridia bacterium]|nr:ComF family protein [Clostridia bacterium]